MMGIKNTAITAQVVIESLLTLLENENVDIASIKFKVGGVDQEYESSEMRFQDLIDIAFKGLGEIEGDYVLVPKECSDEMAEVIAATASVCGGIAGDVYDAVMKQAAVEVMGLEGK